MHSSDIQAKPRVTTRQENRYRRSYDCADCQESRGSQHWTAVPRSNQPDASELGKKR